MARTKNAQAQAVPQSPTTVDVEAILSQNAALMEQNQRLMAALAVSREVAKPEQDAPARYRLENVSNAAVSVQYVSQNGQTKNVILDGRGEWVDLTDFELEYVKDHSPHLFSEGYLSCPEYLADSPNVVRDIAAFLDEIAFNEINDRVAAITAVPVLFAIYNHIENERFVATDADGKPFTFKGEDGQDLPMLKEKEIEPKLMAVETAIQRRIAALTLDRDSGKSIRALMDDN